MDIRKSWNRLVAKLICYILFSVSAISIVTYAWFSLANENHTELISNLTDIEVDYEFYIYEDSLHLGNATPSLIEDVCNLTQDQCYLLVPDPTVAELIEGSVAPGERFSFAIKVRSQGQLQAYLSLDFGGITSENYPRVENMIQTAFMYEVIRVSYLTTESETEDLKSNAPIEFHTNYFTYEESLIYPLVHNVPVINLEFSSSTVIVYFDLYFSNSIFGTDAFGVPYTNSNIFMNQVFSIQHIFMKMSMSPE
ncbi:MAG TPA: hypothetical protein DEG42_05100 [Acholeplasmataceae bacterium]|nr:MAG: hypothetical protein A2013_01240 [Tenericutes bacterium GWE2_38_8]HBY65737.1 hypothetical protein [Acholeplasmataceae bacterium]